MWKPIAESEMLVLLDEEIARLDVLSRPTWKTHKVKLQQVPVEGAEERSSVYVVARSGTEVVLFDDRTEKFATGALDEDGVLRKWTQHSERLGATLRHFPTNRRSTEDE